MHPEPIVIRGLHASLQGRRLQVARIATANPLLQPGLLGHLTLKECSGPRAQILEFRRDEEALWQRLLHFGWRQQDFVAVAAVVEGSHWQ